jgi:hypothetical protein
MQQTKVKELLDDIAESIVKKVYHATNFKLIDKSEHRPDMPTVAIFKTMRNSAVKSKTQFETALRDKYLEKHGLAVDEVTVQKSNQLKTPVGTIHHLVIVTIALGTSIEHMQKTNSKDFEAMIIEVIIAAEAGTITLNVVK